MITGPRARNSARENSPWRFAAVSENSGARDQIPRVSVTFFIPEFDFKVRMLVEQERKQQANQRRHGFLSVARTPSPHEQVRRAIDL